jgi:hypothetical protein
MGYQLFGLAVQGMFPAVKTVLLQFHPSRIVATILFGGVIPVFAIIASQSNYRANIFLFRSHTFSPQTAMVAD